MCLSCRPHAYQGLDDVRMLTSHPVITTDIERGKQRFQLFENNVFAFPKHISKHCIRWRKKQKRSMRQTHKAGEKLFVDYAGQTAPIVSHVTGEIKTAQIFVAVLGASNYTFCEATWSQQLPDWINKPCPSL